jgi:hypothetical protein
MILTLKKSKNAFDSAQHEREFRPNLFPLPLVLSSVGARTGNFSVRTD